MTQNNSSTDEEHDEIQEKKLDAEKMSASCDLFIYFPFYFRQ